MKTLIRVDFSKEIGFGHLKRVEVYTKGIIVCKECDKRYTNFPIIQIENDNQFFDIIKKEKPSEIVIDSYTFKYYDEVKIKKLFPSIKLVCIDDLYKNHYCDEIINPNLCIKPYKNLSDFTKVLFVGPLIKKDFRKQRSYKKEGLFISFGATDAKNITLKVLKQLQNINESINIYTTSANTNVKKLKKFCKLNKKFQLHIDKNIAMAMSKSKFAIISASTLVYEAMQIGIDFIAIKVVDNQEGLEKCLKKKRKKIINIKKIRKLKWILESYQI